MSNICSSSNVRGCPASFYLSCPAYKQGKNCWEAKDPPCCPEGESRHCSECQTYLRALEQGARPVF